MNRPDSPATIERERIRAAIESEERARAEHEERVRETYAWARAALRGTPDHRA